MDGGAPQDVAAAPPPPAGVGGAGDAENPTVAEAGALAPPAAAAVKSSDLGSAHANASALTGNNVGNTAALKAVKRSRAMSNGSSMGIVGGGMQTQSQQQALVDASVSAMMRCPICRGVLRSAYMVPCGHSFCHSCLMQHLENTQTCPSCRRFATKQTVFPNFSLNELVQNMLRPGSAASRGTQQALLRQASSYMEATPTKAQADGLGRRRGGSDDDSGSDGPGSAPPRAAGPGGDGDAASASDEHSASETASLDGDGGGEKQRKMARRASTTLPKGKRKLVPPTPATNNALLAVGAMLPSAAEVGSMTPQQLQALINRLEAKKREMEAVDKYSEVEVIAEFLARTKAEKLHTIAKLRAQISRLDRDLARVQQRKQTVLGRNAAALISANSQQQQQQHQLQLQGGQTQPAGQQGAAEGSSSRNAAAAEGGGAGGGGAAAGGGAGSRPTLLTHGGTVPALEHVLQRGPSLLEAPVPDMHTTHAPGGGGGGAGGSNLAGPANHASSMAGPSSASALLGTTGTAQQASQLGELPLSVVAPQVVQAKKRRVMENLKDLQSIYFGSQRSEGALDLLSDSLSKLTTFTSMKVRATVRPVNLLNASNIVSCIDFDKDDQFFATGGVARIIRIYDFQRIVDEPTGIYPSLELTCKSKVSCLSYNTYFKSALASCDYEGVVTMWDASIGQPSLHFNEHQKRVWCVDFSVLEPTMLASGSDDVSVKIWSTRQKNSVTTLESKANVCSVKFNPERPHMLAFGSADHLVHYYDLRHTREPVKVYDGHRRAVSYVKFLNGREFVSASTDSTLKLWDLNSQDTVKGERTYTGHLNEKNFVGLSVYKDYIVCGSETNSVYLYCKPLSKPLMSHELQAFHPATGIPVKPDPSRFVSAVGWSHHGTSFVAANSQGTIEVLELSNQ